MKKQEESRFAHLAKELAEFKAGKSKMKVTTIDPASRERTVHMESYEEMLARHEDKERAAKQFKKARKGLGLSQRQLASALRVNPRTLEGWESSRFPINPTAEVLMRVMSAHPEIKRELVSTK